MTHTVQHEQEANTNEHKFFLLFLVLLAALILYPYAEGSRIGYYTLRVLGSAAIVVSVYAVSVRRSLLIFALILAGPAFTATSSSSFSNPIPAHFQSSTSC